MRENISSLKKHVLWGSHISFYELMTYVKLTDSKIIIIIIIKNKLTYNYISRISIFFNSLLMYLHSVNKNRKKIYIYINKNHK